VQQPLETKKHLAYIPETVMLYKNLTGLENLEYFSALAGRPDYTRTELLDFLTRVGLQTDAADNRVGTYSKGMRQKVGIAIAMRRRMNFANIASCFALALGDGPRRLLHLELIGSELSIQGGHGRNLHPS
jgi:ABC-type taurine transport system ATPase subunit